MPSLVHTQEVGGSNPLPPTTKKAEVAEWQTRCVQGAVPLRAWEFKSPPRHDIVSPSALVAQRIERSPAEAEAVGSNPAKRAIL